MTLCYLYNDTCCCKIGQISKNHISLMKHLLLGGTVDLQHFRKLIFLQSCCKPRQRLWWRWSHTISPIITSALPWSGNLASGLVETLHYFALLTAEPRDGDWISSVKIESSQLTFWWKNIDKLRMLQVRSFSKTSLTSCRGINVFIKWQWVLIICGLDQKWQSEW